MELLDIYSVVAVFCYSLATIAILTRLFHPDGPNLKLVLTFGCLAIIGHTLADTQFLYANDTINFNLPNVISLVSLLIALAVTAISLRFKVNLLLPVVYGFAGIWQLIILIIPPLHEIPLTAEKLVVFTHIILSLIAYCVLVIATLYSFQVAYINYKLKSKNLTAVSHLPPLMQVERQLFIILAMGTLCLILSSLSGFIFMENFFAKGTLHKTLLSLVALVMYLVILWGHFKRGWRGHRVLILTTTATSILTLSYFGSRFVKEFLLS
ncbi:inner membrane protein YpjD [Colwelliaceae bacterium 6471]